MEFECRNAKTVKTLRRLSDFGRWVGRTGEYNYYWDGADTGETGCACSLNYETSQCEGNNLCNCDANVSL